MTTFTMPASLAALRGTATPRARSLLWGLLALGVLTCGVLWLTDRQKLWYNYLANFLFFTGLAQCGVVWSAVTRGCNARWARPLQRIAESLAAALPCSVVLFIPLMLARRTIYPWWDHPPARKLPWLDHRFLLGRDLGILIVMAALSVYYLYVSVKPDLRNDAGGLTAGGSRAATWAQARLGRLWIIEVFCYCYLWSILGLDLNVSLNPGWYDYIYGWYFFIANWYGGLALISVLAVIWRRRLHAQAIITADILHDNGEITFGFCIFWAYLFWTQFMVLWYANRQDDIRILIRLSQQHPWITLSWITLTLAFFLPFAFGLSRSWKRRPATLVYISCLSLAGMWLAQNLIVDVSLWHRGFPPLFSSALLGAGFLGGYGLIYLWALRRVPIFPVRDPLMHEALVLHPARH
ncbi:MAG TPA: hypothetical protein VN690_04640 [Terriglobales bacterium]|nr:hypothetical protein [Terriglobales bacterium]